MKKRKKKKSHIKNLIVLAIIFIALLIILYLQYNSLLLEYFSYDSKNDLYNMQKQNSSEYEIIKQDYNSKYSGVGQQKVQNKDGYFTTFTTSNNKTFKEYKQNGNASWANNSYWGGTMSENGCGITAIATILSGYGKNYTPEDLRKQYYPVLDNNTISEKLYSKYGIKNSNFFYDANHLSNDNIIQHLSTNRPILICVWNKPKANRWTTTSHYMVLLATDNNGMVYISNPNGLENDAKSSGWYKEEEVIPYIAKALFIQSYN